MPCVTSACLPWISAVAVAKVLVGAQPLGDRSKVTPPMCAVNFNSLLSPLCFFHRNSEHVPYLLGWDFLPPLLALKPTL